MDAGYLFAEDLMLARLRAVVHDESAATMVEYGIMVALIAAVAIVLISTLGKKVSNAFSSVNSGF